MEKTTYLRPEIKVRRIEAENLMAASGEATSTTMGLGGDAPSGTSGDAKRNTFSKTIDWDEEEE